ncbi:MAG: energy-coupling factor transporter transmembrane protein EcfT [Nitrospirae bacterium]|nr:energy-coupling factor transporter transmembrane protein EcfT [Nitrospirota bacterium]
MSPEIKIISYIAFIVCLFLIKDITVYLFIFVAISIFLLRIPFKSLRSGWIPISLFLLFTFISNVLFQHGRILYSTGPFVITEEGFNIASIRTMRVFFMIAGAKILTATTQIELLVGAFGKILIPLERLGIPVVEFFSTMGLTMKALPRLKDQIADTYRERMKEGNIKGFWGRARVISMFLMPLFVKSIQSPESFFDNKENNYRER